jgi:hypothetical protein
MKRRHVIVGLAVALLAGCSDSKPIPAGSGSDARPTANDAAGGRGGSGGGGTGGGAAGTGGRGADAGGVDAPAGRTADARSDAAGRADGGGIADAPVAAPPLDRDYVGVTVDSRLIPRDPSHVQGWDYTKNGMAVEILGSECNDLKSGAALSVGVHFGCPN